MEESVVRLCTSQVITGDFDNEIIAYHTGKLCFHNRVEGEKVSVHRSLNGKRLCSSPNAKLLRTAESQLRTRIVCSRGVPDPHMHEGAKYQSIVDLPEAQEADWSQSLERDILRLNQQVQLAKDYSLDFLRDIGRSALKNFEKGRESTEPKSLREKVKE